MRLVYTTAKQRTQYKGKNHPVLTDELLKDRQHGSVSHQRRIARARKHNKRSNAPQAN